MGKKRLTIWMDFTNTSHVSFLMPIVDALYERYNFVFTARDFSETVNMLKRHKKKFQVIGKHHGSRRIMKVFGMIKRDLFLLKNLPHFDISVAFGGLNATHICTLRGKRSLCFSDNDIVFKGFHSRFGDYFIFPSMIDIDRLIKTGHKKDKIYFYNGYKEDVYIADFIPDESFKKKIPFQDFITIRPENLKASYVPQNIKTIVPDLFKGFAEKNVNILFLPRYKEEYDYVQNYQNVFIPEEPLNGLDVCYNSRAVITGAGTFAREAACLGIPAISFFPGKKMLSVDKKMIEDGWMNHSRDPYEITKLVLNSEKKRVDFTRSKRVKEEVLDILDIILSQIEQEMMDKKQRKV